MTATEIELRTAKGIIYKITNMVNGKCYIGQAINTFYDRYPYGRWWKYERVNEYLTKSAKKHGEKNFGIEILESNKTLEELNMLEPVYIEKFHAFYPEGYCFRKGAGNKIISELSINKSILSRKNGKMRKFKSPNGEIFIVLNLSKFCRENNLSFGGMKGVEKGIYKRSNGWSLPETPDLPEKVFKSPEGKIHRTKNLKSFCKEMGLSYHSMFALNVGNCKSYKGWTKPDYSLDVCHLKSPDQTIHEIKKYQILQFCKTHRLSHNMIYNVLNGNYIQHKGWTLPETPSLIRKLKSPTGEVFEIGPKKLKEFCREQKIDFNTTSRVLTGELKQSKGWTKA